MTKSIDETQGEGPEHTWAEQHLSPEAQAKVSQLYRKLRITSEGDKSPPPSPEEQEVLQAASEAAGFTPPPAEQRLYWGMIVIKDGKPPKLMRFDSVEKMIEQMMRLDDDEYYVMPFFGIVLPFTRAPYRRLCLTPVDHLPLYDSRDLSEEEAEELPPPELQEDWFLGHDELITPVSYHKETEHPLLGAPPEEDDEEEEDEE